MKLMILDGNSIINRAYFGVRPLTTRDGLYTHAIFGFLNIMQRLENEDLVDYCQVTTAATETHYGYVDGRPLLNEEAIYGVTAQIIAYLSTPEEEG